MPTPAALFTGLVKAQMAPAIRQLKIEAAMQFFSRTPDVKRMALLRRVCGRLFNSAGARAFPAGGIIVAIVAIAGDRASTSLSIKRGGRACMKPELRPVVLGLVIAGFAFAVVLAVVRVHPADLEAPGLKFVSPAIVRK
jgi:hypothetical protein